ncbi:tyrosine-type recombinase/integrase [Anaeroselena agilis]|uniref:Tyrosine-type recombinase/integrase n=1 Tax=Anaeroselena agilis TaxID=3063788 RepID=A0ABU3NUW5_9FIRM|nr:tyrosine-type recombinase/integrase [Selenomonadales bacterium 4137-cl]
MATQRRPKGEGSLQELPNGKFKVQVDAGWDTGGNRKRVTFTSSSKAEAIRRLNEFKADKIKGSLVGSSSTTLADLIERWLKAKKQLTKRSSYDSYKGICEQHLTPALGKLKVQKLTTARLNDYLSGKLAEGLSNNTVSKHRVLLHDLLDLALREGIVSRNVSEMCHTVVRKKANIGVLNKEECQLLLETARGLIGRKTQERYIYYLVLLALATGMRRGELVALRWGHINKEAATITVKDSLIEVAGGIHLDSPKTADSRRTIAVDKSIIETLSELKNPNYDLIFHRGKGEEFTPSRVGKLFSALLTQCSLEGYRFHDLRHTHATQLIASGVNVKVVSQRLGHANIKTTLDLYVHVLPEHDKQAADIMGAWLGANKVPISDNEPEKTRENQSEESSNDAHSPGQTE